MKSAVKVPLKDWVLLNLEIGALSFGGAGRILLFQEAVVDKNEWLSDDDFQNIMTVSQVLPGANLLNLSIQLGLTLNGPLGAFLGLMALGIPGALVALGIVSALDLDSVDVRRLFQGFSLASVMLFTVFIARLYQGIHRRNGHAVSQLKFLCRLTIAAIVALCSSFDVPLQWTLLLGIGLGFLVERYL